MAQVATVLGDKETAKKHAQKRRGNRADTVRYTILYGGMCFGRVSQHRCMPNAVDGIWQQGIMQMLSPNLKY